MGEYYLLLDLSLLEHFHRGVECCGTRKMR
jgi:hypothetical protein